MSSPQAVSVTLRPLTKEDVDQFARTFVHREDWGEFEWFGYSTHDHLYEGLARDGFLGKESAALAIEADGKWAGRVLWWRNYYGGDPSWCWRFAVIVDPAQRGRGIGTRGQRLMVDYLFSHTAGNRIEAHVDARNIAELKAMEKSGFTREGTVRGSMWSEGSWHDQILHSILRQDWQQPGPAE